jgi:hypothetical protein
MMKRFASPQHDRWDEWQAGILKATKLLFGETEVSTAFMEDFVKTSNAFHRKHMKKVKALSKAQS